MTNFSLFVFISQLGLSVALPLAGFVLLAVWLKAQFYLSSWVIWVGVILGLVCAVEGLRSTLKIMERLAKDKKERNQNNVSFNNHD